MKKLGAIALMMVLLAGSAALASQQAMDFYHRGVESELASRKIAYFTRAVELDPFLVAAYEKRGMLYYFQDRFDAVIADYLRVTELQPHNADAFRILSAAYLHKNMPELAIAAASRALELDPKLAAAYANRAEAFRLKGDWDAAIRDASTAIKLQGDPRVVARAYKTRSLTYKELGEEKLAEADMKSSFEVDPRFYLYRYFAKAQNLQGVSRLGLMGIVGILFVLIFKLNIPAPKK